VLALELVLPDGSCFELGSATGFAPGFDWVGAVVGSEGTLGIVTAITVRLSAIPESVETLLAIFPDVVSACRAVGMVIEAALVPAALEIVDQRTIRAVEDSVYAAGLPRDAGAILIVELDGPAVALPAQIERVRELCGRAGADRVEIARDEAERQRFWRARKGAFGAMGRLAPDLYVHDAVVPRSALPVVLEKVCEIGDRYGLTLSNVFHAGDGNLHPHVLFDANDPAAQADALEVWHRILRMCIDYGGTISGEHGVGIEKRPMMAELFAAGDLAVMERVRGAFDPDRRLNPGKILPGGAGCGEAKARGSFEAMRGFVGQAPPTGEGPWI